MLQGEQPFPVDTVGLVLAAVHLVVDRLETLSYPFQMPGVSGHPVDRAGGEYQHATGGAGQQPAIRQHMAFGIDHNSTLDAQQVVQPFIGQGVYLDLDPLLFMLHRQRIAEDVFQTSLGTLLLDVERSGHRVAVCDAGGRMPEPLGFAAPCLQGPGGVQQFVRRMDSQIHERDIVLRRLRTTDVFEDVEAERFAQVVVVPVPPERERDMKNTFLHQHLRAFQQVEG